MPGLCESYMNDFECACFLTSSSNTLVESILCSQIKKLTFGYFHQKLFARLSGLAFSAYSGISVHVSVFVSNNWDVALERTVKHFLQGYRERKNECV